MGKIIIKRTSNGGYHFTIVANNSEVVGVSQTYKSLKSAENGIESIRKNVDAPVEDQTLARGFEEKKCPKWVIYKDAADDFRFRLLAANGEIILAASEGYSRRDSAKKGMDSIRNNADSEIIVKEDE